MPGRVRRGTGEQARPDSAGTRTAPTAGAGSLGRCRAVTGTRGRRRWGRTRRTDTGCTTCWATCGNGRKTAGTKLFRSAKRRKLVGAAEIVVVVWCAGAPGSTGRGTSARPIASGSAPVTASAFLVFVLPGRSPHESLPPSSRGCRGGAPGESVLGRASGCRLRSAWRVESRMDRSTRYLGCRCCREPSRRQAAYEDRSRDAGAHRFPVYRSFSFRSCSMGLCRADSGPTR